MAPSSTSTSTRRKRFRLTLEYAGAGFSGWQKQTNARTIQGTLLEVGAEIFSDKLLDIQGHGRTDAGVHALNYTAHLETSDSRLTPAEIRDRFNTLLPASIVILDVSPCDPRFHARHTCVGRSYLYQVSTRKTVFNKTYSWWPKAPLDSEAMADAAGVFVGMHDFAAFAEKPEMKKSTKVLVNGVFIYEDDEIIRLRVVGSHFLWKMVRRMAGILVEVGKGNLTPEQVESYLSDPTQSTSSFTAPASGLFCEKAFYDEEEFNHFLEAAAAPEGSDS
ncbi:MAG: tRNA pseudouridine(38-40) synthase TruA [Verrucomicrobia bacterium]|mgnify:CR=1 FL=1|jgi:tRNA pseudouridine38-40 synthase|nr:tRNA pseudouridine(38-40) synthase TruA [Verrucomicrobiota bacterium]MBT7067118.1 tRNA pseudouridine(38-40) synthase TruA [Verrucomicrobiota bacterium]MBT7699252.1 tRNA pseudouridine(38-40) synthase TruA [Verrucomicrobiota bacterium]